MHDDCDADVLAKRRSFEEQVDEFRIGYRDRADGGEVGKMKQSRRPIGIARKLHEMLSRIFAGDVTVPYCDRATERPVSAMANGHSDPRSSPCTSDRGASCPSRCGYASTQRASRTMKSAQASRRSSYLMTSRRLPSKWPTSQSSR